MSTEPHLSRAAEALSLASHHLKEAHKASPGLLRSVMLHSLANEAELLERMVGAMLDEAPAVTPEKDGANREDDSVFAALENHLFIRQ